MPDSRTDSSVFCTWTWKRLGPTSGWSSSCDDRYQGARPSHCGWRFCPYCGRQVVEIEPQDA